MDAVGERGAARAGPEVASAGQVGIPVATDSFNQWMAGSPTWQRCRRFWMPGSIVVYGLTSLWIYERLTYAADRAGPVTGPVIGSTIVLAAFVVPMFAVG